MLAAALPVEARILRSMTRGDGSNTLPTVLVNVIQLLVAIDYRLYARSVAPPLGPYSVHEIFRSVR